MRLNYAIVFVSDMQRSITFYRDVVGLPLRFESPSWSEFASDGATLALHSATGDGGGSVDGDLPPGRCRPGFSVQDLNEFHRRMTESNVPCSEEPKDVFGSRIAQYADPDGLVLSVSEDRKPPGAGEQRSSP